MAYDEKTADRVRALLSDRPNVVERKMMGGLCFMVGGHMCCTVSGRGGLMVRVGPEEHDLMLREPHVQSVQMAGRTMTGFLRVTPEGYQTEAALRTVLNRALSFTATLPAKRTPRVSRRARHRDKP